PRIPGSRAENSRPPRRRSCGGAHSRTAPERRLPAGWRTGRKPPGKQYVSFPVPLLSAYKAVENTEEKQNHRQQENGADGKVGVIQVFEAVVDKVLEHIKAVAGVLAADEKNLPKAF